MKKRLSKGRQSIILCFATLCLPCFVLGQSINECKAARAGVFYFYPAKSSQEFLVLRNDTLQREIDLQTKDTSFWRVRWRTNCSFTLQFIRRTGSVSNEELLFLNSYRAIIEILQVKKGYYVFKGSLENANVPVVIDTIWLNKRK